MGKPRGLLWHSPMAKWWQASSLVFAAICISPLEMYPFLWVFTNSVPWPQECSYRTKLDTDAPLTGRDFQMSTQTKDVIFTVEAFGNYRITKLFPGINLLLKLYFANFVSKTVTSGLESHTVEDWLIWPNTRTYTCNASSWATETGRLRTERQAAWAAQWGWDQRAYVQKDRKA